VLGGFVWGHSRSAGATLGWDGHKQRFWGRGLKADLALGWLTLQRTGFLLALNLKPCWASSRASVHLSSSDLAEKT
jgi:hypothetical protein